MSKKYDKAEFVTICKLPKDEGGGSGRANFLDGLTKTENSESLIKTPEQEKKYRELRAEYFATIREILETSRAENPRKHAKLLAQYSSDIETIVHFLFSLNKKVTLH
jgi:hypothetical protein